MTGEPLAVKIRLFVALSALCVAALANSCSRGGRVVDKVGWAEWSRDGQALYYLKYDVRRRESDVYRYDIGSHRKRIYYDMRNLESEGFRLSPDEHQMVFVRYGEGLYVGDSRTGRATKVYATSREITGLYWIRSDIMVFSEYTGVDKRRVYFLNPTTRSIKLFEPALCLEFAAYDSSGFLYTDKANRHRFHNLRDGTDKLLPPHVSSGDINFLYLDAHKLIYNVWPLDYEYTEILDVKTMRTRRITLPDAYPEMLLSPDLRRYWRTTGPIHSEWESSKLYLVDLPPKVVEQLKSPVK